MQRIVKTAFLRAMLASAALSAFGANAQSAGTDFPAVQPAEQASRDIDRVRILQDELAKEQARLADAAKRRAERLAARDAQGVQEAEAAQQRATSSLAALRREIALASRAPHTSATPVVATTTRTPTRATRPPVETTTAPWWDVYSKPPRREAEAARQQLSATGEPAAVTAERAR